MAYLGVLPVRFERTLDGTSCRCLCRLDYGSVPPAGFEPALSGFWDQCLCRLGYDGVCSCLSGG